MSPLPLEYQKGYTDFLNCHIDLSLRPLIPRIETAEWVKVAILEIARQMHVHPAGNFGKTVRILDMFAGSGCVGLAVLKHLEHYPNVMIDFADISPKCLRQVKVNCDLNGIPKERYRLIQSDVFGGRSREVNSNPNLEARYGFSSTSRSAGFNRGGYDFILANPPYCLEKNVDESVLRYEPKQGVLGGGKDGLRVIKRFLTQAARYLKPGGQIFMEFDDFQKPLLEKWLKTSKYTKWEFKKDQFGRDRLLLISEP